MTIHLYFSLTPEALIASMLAPEQFGQYYATGHQYKSKGQAIFFEVDPKFRDAYFDIDAALKLCVAHPDGRPKNSTYVSIYRVLEHLPVSALGALHLSTAYGHTLTLKRSPGLPPVEKGLHLYQDFAPANSLVTSALDPARYYASVTQAPAKFIRFPGLAFVELGLGALAADPLRGSASDLPYDYIHHLREALLQIRPGDKPNKLVHRVHSSEFPYRMVQGGFYVGNGPDLAFYAMPSHATLRGEHSGWWHSANV
jgi:hypothetical protein